VRLLFAVRIRTVVGIDGLRRRQRGRYLHNIIGTIDESSANPIHGNGCNARRKGTKAQEGVASKRYCEQIAGIAQEHMEEISNNMSYSKFNPYGFRKGAATYAVSGTTAPPSMPSVARWGEWSIGSVLDVYWHFASVGDHYLGRMV
jgi:hypothetical protein